MYSQGLDHLARTERAEMLSGTFVDYMKLLSQSLRNFECDHLSTSLCPHMHHRLLFLPVLLGRERYDCVSVHLPMRCFAVSCQNWWKQVESSESYHFCQLSFSWLQIPTCPRWLEDQPNAKEPIHLAHSINLLELNRDAWSIARAESLQPSLV